MKISKLLKKSSKKKSLPPSTSVQRKKKSQDPAPPPSSPPTRKNVTFVANANGRPVEDDEISAMTRGTDMPESPDRSSSYGKTYNFSNNNAPPQPLLSSGFSNDDDSSSQDLLVFEDKTDDSLGSLPGIATSKVVASGLSGTEKSPLRVRFSEDSITMSAAAGTTSRQLFDSSNTKKSSKQNQKQSSSKLRSSAISKLVKKKASYLTNTEYFRNTVNAAFDKIDTDNSGDVTLEELYAGLLLIHLKMAIYVGAPACRVSLISCVFCCCFLCRRVIWVEKSIYTSN